MFSTLGYWICWPFAWLTRQFYELTGSYGVALILFTLVVKLVLLPFMMKSKRSMIRMNMVSGQLQEIQKRYANNREKMAEEQQRLYQENGINPMSGCLWSFIPMPILIALYYIIRQPITHFMMLSKEVCQSLVEKAIAAGIDMSAILTYDKEGAAVLKDGLNQFTPYGQINLVNAINTQHPELADGISGWMNVDYHFLGIDLGASASDALGMIKSAGLTWAAVGIIVMVLLAAASQVVNMKISMMGQPQQAAANATNKTMMLIMPLMTLWIGYTLPAALSLYWLAQSVFSAIQDLILNKAYLKKIREAEEERARAITEDRKARQEEARQRQIQQQAEAKARQRERNRQIQEAKKKGGQKKASTTEAGRVGDRPYARGRAYREHDDE